MQGTNVLFGQIAVVFGIVIAGVWGATQWTAAALGYQLRLGSPWFDFFGTPVYHPWKLFEWWFVFDAYAPEVFNTGGMMAGGSGLVAVLVAIGMSVWRSRQSVRSAVVIAGLNRISTSSCCTTAASTSSCVTAFRDSRMPCGTRSGTPTLNSITRFDHSKSVAV